MSHAVGIHLTFKEIARLFSKVVVLFYHTCQLCMKVLVQGGTWVAQLVKHLPLAQVMIAGSWDWVPIGLPAQRRTCFFLSFCHSSSLCSLTLSLCQINKIFLKKESKL